MAIKYKFEEVKKIIEDYGFKMISEEYNDCHSQISIMDSFGYKYLTTFGIMLSGNRNFKKFHQNNIYTIENIKLWLVENYVSLELISDIYNKAKEDLTWKCKKCNSIFNEKLDLIVHSNKRCTVCCSKFIKLNDLQMLLKEKDLYLMDDIIAEEFNGKYNFTFIDKKGYKYYSNYSNLTSRKSHQKYDKNKYSLFNIELWLRKHMPNVVLLDKVYLNCKTIMTWKCKKDNYIWEMSWATLKNSKGCPLCNCEALNSDGIKNEIKNIPDEVAKKVFLDKGLFLKDKYVNNITKLLAVDNFGYKYYSTVNNVKKSKDNLIRNLFSKSNIYVIENIKLWLSLNRPDISILSDTYTGSKNIMFWKCNIDGIEWGATWDDIRSMTGCPECVNRKRRGEFSPSWKGGLTVLYEYLRHKIIDWKKESLKKCNYKCFVTGGKIKAIHHLYGFDLIVKEALINVGLSVNNRCFVKNLNECDLKNITEEVISLHEKYGLGVCLSEEIHNEFHSIYGYGDNTPNQFMAYYKFKTGLDFNYSN